MRVVLVLVLALALAGCGAAAERTGVPASSGVESVPVETETKPFDESKLKPPPILLLSAAGKQEAVAGSFCSDYVDPSSGQGSGVCGDSGPVTPDEMTAVRTGDEVAFVLTGAAVVRAEGCQAEDEQSCIGSVSVRPLGCTDRQVAEVPLELGERTEWTVGLEPGAYQLDVFAHFEAFDGPSGDVSGSLGLLVAPEGPPRKIPVDLDLAVCSFPD